MRKIRISEILGWILIAGGVFIMGLVVYRSVSPYFPGKFKISTLGKLDRPKPKAKSKPPPQPVKESEQILKVKKYLKKTNTQLVEGLSAIDAFSNQGNYASWKGGVQSWWIHSEKKDQEVVWQTAACPQKKATTLVFSGLLGVGAGEAQLFVNDKPVLTFNTGIGPEIEEWKKGSFRLKLFAMRVKSNQERLGIFCLTVPKEEVTVGEVIRLKVTGYKKTGPQNSFFVLSDWPNTLKNLRLN